MDVYLHLQPETLPWWPEQATMGANALGEAMEFVADSVEVGLETGIGADGRAFKPAITTTDRKSVV